MPKCNDGIMDVVNVFVWCYSQSFQSSFTENQDVIVYNILKYSCSQ